MLSLALLNALEVIIRDRNQEIFRSGIHDWTPFNQFSEEILTGKKGVAPGCSLHIGIFAPAASGVSHNYDCLKGKKSRKTGYFSLHR